MTQKDTKVGLPPGTVVHTGMKRTEEVTMYIMEFDDGDMREYATDSIDDCLPTPVETAYKWVHVNGVHDVEIVKTIGEYYAVHPLIIEDIPSIEQRPKIEDMANGVYVVLRAFDIDSLTHEVVSEQVSIIMGKHFVLTFQESKIDIFDAIRARARQKGERIRKNGTDYLTYALLDLLVDKYFVVLEEVGNNIEDLEDQLIQYATSEMLSQIYITKRYLLALRRHIWPLRQVILQFERDQADLVQDENRIYLRDLYDHIIRVADLVETYRESITGMMDIYLSSVSNRMNEVMKVLTVISTIFVPLTLAASVYGMNWKWMPELEFYYGYPVFLAVMFIVTMSLVGYFRRRKWV